MIDELFQRQRLTAAITGAGERYDTAVNVKLESILHNLYATNREEPYLSGMLKVTYKIINDIPSLSHRQDYDKKSEVEALITDLKAITDRVVAIKSKAKSQRVMWGSLIASTDDLADKCYDLYSYFRDEKEKENTPKEKKEFYSSLTHDLWDIYRGLRDLSELFSNGIQTKLFNVPRLLLHGEAGIGKTHLLCDYAKARIDAKRATLIYLGHELQAVSGSRNPVSRMATLAGFSTRAEFITELEALANSSQERICLIVDAINEADGVDWEKLMELTQIEGLSLVISLRDGYEFVLKNPDKYSSIKHSGFSEVAWEGVSQFFKHYGLKLPEIPIVDPEFKNPLFLRIFCKSYSTPGKTPRGHGATHVFEHYIANQSEKIYGELGITLPSKYLWIHIIKPIGVWMGKNGTNRLLHQKLVDFINADANLKPHAARLPDLLESNGLLLKYPHFTKSHKRSGYAYYFTYQRFSDHLIVRSILTENAIEGADASSKAQEYFKNDSFFKDIIHRYDSGLVEALAIQIPERCKGDELPWLIDEEYRDLDIVKKAFLEGLKWRDVTAMDSNGELKYFNDQQTTNYLKEYFTTDNDFFDALACMYDVCAIPNHPFNALRIHKLLSRHTMANRDSWFQGFLLNNSYEGDSLSRLHSWSFSKLVEDASGESAGLAASALLWATASTSSRLRDLSTRAVVALLSRHPDQIAFVFESFINNNDPYIKERLYAVVYGCASAISADEQSLTTLAKLLYEKHFSIKNRYANAIIDDYAFVTIELYLRLYGNKLHFKKEVYSPPYSYEFPRRIHSIKWLRSKYHDNNNEYYSIWGSLMYNYGALADFGRYTMGGALNGFTSLKLSDSLPKTTRGKVRNFERALNRKQDRLYTEYRRLKSLRHSFLTNRSEKVFLEITRTEKTRQELLKEDPRYYTKLRITLLQLIISLSPHKLVNFLRLRPYLVDRKELPNREDSRYDLGIAQRWIFTRVIQLGWDPKKHGDFEKYTAGDRALSRDRARIERIGKKYQWIGLHEFAAYLGANYYLSHDYWESKEEFSRYRGAHQIGIRDFDPTVDPTLIANRQSKSESKDRWWIPPYSAWETPGWEHTTNDVPAPSSIITSSQGGESYYNLRNFVTWKGRNDPPEDEERYNYPELWMRCQGYIIKSKDLPKVISWSKDKEFWDHTLPDPNDYSGDVFLKEFEGSRAYDEEFHYIGDGWDNAKHDRPFDINQPVQYYSNSSVSDLTINLPSPYLVKTLGLFSRSIGRYSSRDDTIQVFDPSIDHEDFGSTLLVSRDAFIKRLEEKGLTVFWAILGEKIRMKSGGQLDEYRGERLEIHGICYLGNNGTIVEGTRYKNAVEIQ